MDSNRHPVDHSSPHNTEGDHHSDPHKNVCDPHSHTHGIASHHHSHHHSMSRGHEYAGAEAKGHAVLGENSALRVSVARRTHKMRAQPVVAAKLAVVGDLYQPHHKNDRTGMVVCRYHDHHSS